MRNRRLKGFAIILLAGSILWSFGTGISRYGLFGELLGGLVLILLAAHGVEAASRKGSALCLAAVAVPLALYGAQSLLVLKCLKVGDWSGRADRSPRAEVRLGGDPARRRRPGPRAPASAGDPGPPPHARGMGRRDLQVERHHGTPRPAASAGRAAPGVDLRRSGKQGPLGRRHAPVRETSPRDSRLGRGHRGRAKGTRPPGVHDPARASLRAVALGRMDAHSPRRDRRHRPGAVRNAGSRGRRRHDAEFEDTTRPSPRPERNIREGWTTGTASCRSNSCRRS